MIPLFNQVIRQNVLRKSLQTNSSLCYQVLLVFSHCKPELALIAESQETESNKKPISARTATSGCVVRVRHSTPAFLDRVTICLPGRKTAVLHLPLQYLDFAITQDQSTLQRQNCNHRNLCSFAKKTLIKFNNRRTGLEHKPWLDKVRNYLTGCTSKVRKMVLIVHNVLFVNTLPNW